VYPYKRLLLTKNNQFPDMSTLFLCLKAFTLQRQKKKRGRKVRTDRITERIQLQYLSNFPLPDFPINIKKQNI